MINKLDMIEKIAGLLNQYGDIVYFIIFFTVFGETGVIIAGFLPGDSLVFAAGALSASGKLNILLLMIIIPLASICGNSFNYFTGRIIGKKLVEKFHGRLINKKNIEKSHDFYTKYGRVAIVIGRFLPVLRSLIPFTAGIGNMNFIRFSIYNAIGSILWSYIFVLSGYFLGNIKLFRENFWIMVVLAALVPVIMVIITFGIRYIILIIRKNRKR